jgi:hypothetical protein
MDRCAHRQESDIGCLVCEVVRGYGGFRLEGPKGRRTAEPINRPQLPVLRFVLENSHGASFRKIHIKDAMVFVNSQMKSCER